MRFWPKHLRFWQKHLHFYKSFDILTKKFEILIKIFEILTKIREYTLKQWGDGRVLSICDTIWDQNHNWLSVNAWYYRHVLREKKSIWGLEHFWEPWAFVAPFGITIDYRTKKVEKKQNHAYRTNKSKKWLRLLARFGVLLSKSHLSDKQDEKIIEIMRAFWRFEKKSTFVARGRAGYWKNDQCNRRVLRQKSNLLGGGYWKNYQYYWRVLRQKSNFRGWGGDL